MFGRNICAEGTIAVFLCVEESSEAGTTGARQDFINNEDADKEEARVDHADCSGAKGDSANKPGAMVQYNKCIFVHLCPRALIIDEEDLCAHSLLWCSTETSFPFFPVLVAMAPLRSPSSYLGISLVLKANLESTFLSPHTARIPDCLDGFL